MKQYLIKTLIVGFMLSGSSKGYSYDSCCSDLCDNNCCDWFAYGNYLYLNVCRSHLDYAYAFDATPDPSTGIGQGELKTIDDKWDSGFRVGLGYRCNNKMDFHARYTYFHTTNKLTDTFENLAGATRVLLTSGLMFFFSTLTELATPDYRLTFSVLDLETGFWQAPICYLNIRPYIGVRLAFFNQDMDTFYQSSESPGSVFSVNDPQSMNTNAYGIMMGFDARYELCEGFYFITRSSIGALYGINDYNTINTLISAYYGTETYADVRGHDCQSLISSEISAGLEYFLCGVCGSNLTFSTGYELHTWYGFTEFINFTGYQNFKTSFTRNEGSLLLHGLFARLEASF